MTSAGRRSLWTALLLLVLCPGVAHGVPTQIPYRGNLTAEDGTPITDHVTVEVGLYAAAEGGAPVWGPFVYPELLVQDGVLSLVLGELPSAPLKPEVIAEDALWLDFIVNGHPLKPRQRVLSVPFALRAADAHQLGGVDATNYVTFDDVNGGAFVRTGQVGRVAQSNRYEDLDGLPDLSGILRADGTVALEGPWDLGGHPLSGLVVGGGTEPPEVASSGALWFDTSKGALAVYDGAAWRVLDDVAETLSCTGCVEMDALAFQLSAVAQTGAWTDLEGAPVMSEYLRADGSTPMTADLNMAGHSLVSARVEQVPSSVGLTPDVGRLIVDLTQGRLEMGDGSQWVPATGALAADGSLTITAATIAGDTVVEGLLTAGQMVATDVDIDGTLHVGGVSVVDTMNQLEDEVVAAHAALEAAESQIWCLENCAPGAHPCNVIACDGASASCVVQGAAQEGTPCGDGLGTCQDGSCCVAHTCESVGVACGEVSDGCGGTLTCPSCGLDETCSLGQCHWNQSSCGGVTCPEVTGYDHRCNAQDHCEYTRRVQFQDWQAHDVWIYVPPGTFPMGQTEIDPVAFLWNLPSHDVTLAEGYLIGRFEVTVGIHEACEADGACSAPVVDPTDLSVDDFGVSRTSNGRTAHPQNGLTRSEASTICGWLGGRLPSEAEWEYAATGTSHRIYPWGNEPAPSCAASNGAFGLEAGDKGLGPGTRGCGSDSTYPVGSTPAGLSATGASDMAGNLFEWVQDCWHNSYEGAPADGSPWLDTCQGSVGVIRGSDYRRAPNLAALAIRVERDPEKAGGHVGVRCVKEP